MRIGVIGAGSFGTAISFLLLKKGYEVVMWSFLKEDAININKDRENKQFLPGVKLLGEFLCTNSLEVASSDMDLIITVVPSFATRQTAKALSPFIKEGQIIVNLSKGLEENTLYRLSQVYEQEIPKARICVMSGPSHAEEVGKELPTTNVVASYDKEAAQFVQDTLMSETFRVYLSDDPVGVELGGALKNVIALCAGICDGLGYGDNTKAALMTRGLAEIKRLGVKMGAKAETFSGLSGIGDLIVTCTSMHSRNRRCGILLGEGKKLKDACDEVKMVVEGVNTAKAAYQLGQKYEVLMPIVSEANKILFEDKNPRHAVVELMNRDKTVEH